MTLWTVGHGARSLEELVAVVEDGGVERIVDVRSFPGSRRHPHFGREALTASLPKAEIAYEWWSELGGRRRQVERTRHPAWRNESFRAYADHMDTPAFREELGRLLASAAEQPSAVMCSETLWWRCHRRLIADAATLAGTEVVHLLGVDKHQEHPLHPELRVGEDGWPVYDAGQEPLGID